MPNGFMEGFQNGMAPAYAIQEHTDRLREQRRQEALRNAQGNFYGGIDPQAGEIARLGGDPRSALQDRDGQTKQMLQRAGQVATILANAPDENSRRNVFRQARSALEPVSQHLGLPLPPDWDESYLDEVQSIARMFASNGDVPAGLQQFRAMTNGLTAEDELKARRIELGLDPRASSGLPYGFTKRIGEDGREYIIQTNRRDGGAAVIDEGGAPVGAGSGARPSAIDLAGELRQFGAQITSGFRDPQRNVRVGGVPNSQHMAGTAFDAVIPPQIKAQAIEYGRKQGYEVIDEGDHVHFELPPQGRVPGLGPSRTPEEQATLTTAATEQAKIDAQVRNAPAVAAAEAEVEGAKTGAKARAETLAKAEADLPRIRDNAYQALGVIDQALKAPGLKKIVGLGTWNPANRIPGGDSADAYALIDQIKGKTFLEAFNSLKGGGQITEAEGQKATDALARLNLNQSEQGVRKALQELQTIILMGYGRARKAAGVSNAPKMADADRQALLDKY